MSFAKGTFFYGVSYEGPIIYDIYVGGCAIIMNHQSAVDLFLSIGPPQSKNNQSAEQVHPPTVGRLFI
jgi:hypothetical protein